MDIYAEKLVKHKKSSLDLTIQSLVLAFATIIIFGLLFIVTPLILVYYLGGSLGLLLGFGLAVGVGYGALKIIWSYNIEYEYILTNGELDVDKIIQKRERKRLLTVQAKDFTAFGKISQEILDQSYDTRILAYSELNRPDTRYAVFSSDSLGRTLLVFNPGDELEEKLLSYIPAAARKEL